MTGRRLPAALLVLAVAAWIVEAAWDLYPHIHITDLPVYEDAARHIADGAVPYRDFPFEYPPLAAGLVAFARLLPVSYPAAFHILMLGSLCALVLATVALARALGLGERRTLAAGAVVALLPVILGDFLATRFDLVVAALVAWTLWAAAAGRFRLAWGLLAAAVALKLAPVVLVPVLFVWHRHRGDRPIPIRAAVAAAGAVVATFMPFVIASPQGVWRLLEYHLNRPLQIESLGASYLLGLNELAGITLRVEPSYGSHNLAGSGPRAIAVLSTVLAVAAIVVISVIVALLLRRAPPPAGVGIFVTGAAATLAAAVAGGKVLSPQFLVWLVPACLLVPGRYGRAALVVTAVAFAATQLYFPVRYWDLVALETTPVVMLIVRNALLIAVVALAWPRPVAGAGAVRSRGVALANR